MKTFCQNLKSLFLLYCLIHLPINVLFSQELVTAEGDHKKTEKSGQVLWEELVELYPNLNAVDFKIKLAGAQDPFHFLRTFVPYYYTLIRDSPLASFARGGEDFKSLWGHCVGDAHPENFGVVLNDKGQGLFTMNDVDDAGRCPLFSDFLRFLVSVRLFDKNIDLQPLIREYLSALDGNDVFIPAIIAKMTKKTSGGIFPNPKVFSNIEKNELLCDSYQVRIEGNELSSLSRTVRNLYGESSRLLDAISYKKSSGGSGGLFRYRVLVDLAHLNMGTQLLEFKETAQPGVFPVSDPESLGVSTKERIFKTLSFEQKDAFTSLYQVVAMGKKEVFVRPRWKGNKGIDLTDYTASELKEILAAEASVLGHIHRQSAEELPKYLQGTRLLEDGDWIKSTEEIAVIMEETFKKLGEFLL